MIKKIFITAILLFAILVLSPLNVFARVLHTTERTNFRKSPTLDGEHIRTYPAGTVVFETERLSDGWSAVTINDENGYMFNKYLSDAPVIGVSPNGILYTQTNVNFRKDPSTTAQIHVTLPPATPVNEIERLADGWSKVEIDGVYGYISNQYLCTQIPAREMYTLSNINFRVGPDVDSDVIDILPAGTKVIEIERLFSGWSLVERSDGRRAYIFNEHIGTEEAYKNSQKFSPKSTSTGNVSSTSGSEVSKGSTDRRIQEISASGVELIDWQTMKSLFTIGKDALVTDVWTGAQYYIRSFSNGNHADVEPVSQQDTATMLATFGGQWTWDTRPIWVTINGRTFAASINGMPHGGGVNANNGMNGQICVHFRGSTTHNGNKSHENSHQASITQAWNAAN